MKYEVYLFQPPVLQNKIGTLSLNIAGEEAGSFTIAFFFFFQLYPSFSIPLLFFFFLFLLLFHFHFYSDSGFGQIGLAGAFSLAFGRVVNLAILVPMHRLLFLELIGNSLLHTHQ